MFILNPKKVFKEGELIPFGKNIADYLIYKKHLSPISRDEKGRLCFRNTFFLQHCLHEMNSILKRYTKVKLEDKLFSSGREVKLGNKLRFAIDNAEIIEDPSESSHFATARIHAFSTGKTE